MKVGDVVKHCIKEELTLEEMEEYGDFDGELVIFEISDEPGDTHPYLAGKNSDEVSWFSDKELELIEG
jgi:hypothetical protein